ncbi:sigma-70 family RNA polymerase sigma factor [Bacillus sp. CGMCC 1.16607]|uniref:sigma-70 family RNA polymerase sigma factor n=1 Tax=Bacillus sp. CGMCC 1.16607 TaxID=3351842 RepID=UPI0036421642
MANPSTFMNLWIKVSLKVERKMVGNLSIERIKTIMETKMIKGELKTRDQAVIENMKLVCKVANKYRLKGKRAGLEIEDLESIGSIGLMKAFDHFDDSMGYQFSTFATPKILGEITLAIRQSADTALRYPPNVKDCADLIFNRGLIGESPEVIVKKLKKSPHNVKYALEYMQQKAPLRLNQKVKEDGGILSDLLGELQDQSDIFVQDFLCMLSENERSIAVLLIDGYGPTEAGRALGYSRSYCAFHKPNIQQKLEEYLSDEKIS